MKKMTMILFSIVLILLSGCARLKVEENNTLIEYLDNKYGKAEKGGYEKNNIKCDVLKDNYILYINGDIFILKDGTSYEYIEQGNKVYKNNQQCKKKETDIIIQKVVGDYFIGKDDKVYSSLYTKGDYNIESDFELLTKNNDIVSDKKQCKNSINKNEIITKKIDAKLIGADKGTIAIEYTNPSECKITSCSSSFLASGDFNFNGGKFTYDGVEYTIVEIGHDSFCSDTA